MTDSGAVRQIRWGIVGPGRIANKFADALSAVDDSSLRAVASRSMERAEAFRRQWGGHVAYQGYERLADDPSVDAVYVATPHRFHFDNAMLCLEAGKHVLCEKPLAVNQSQAAALVRASRERGLFLMEALWTRFLPVYRLARTWLDEGRIGEVRQASSSFSFLAARDPQGRLLNLELAGGALLDLGVYNVALSQWAFSENPQTIQVLGYIGETGVDEIISAGLDYGSGRMSQFVCGFRANTENDLRIYGTSGQIRVHPPFWGGESATLVSDGRETTVTRPPKLNGFEYQIEAAAACIRDGRIESEVMPHADTVANAKVMDEIRSRIGLSYPFE